MKVLVVGGGGREHAIAWALRRDDPSLELIAAPGNPGLADLGRCVSVPVGDVAALADLARRERVDLTVVGPEAPLDAGLVDHFRAEGLAAFGPTRGAARIETSKAWAKRLMLKAGIPTASAQTFTEVADAKAEVRRLAAPVVVKATGLAAGKGVVVAQTIAEADEAIAMMLESRAFGEAGDGPDGKASQQVDHERPQGESRGGGRLGDDTRDQVARSGTQKAADPNEQDVCHGVLRFGDDVGLYRCNSLYASRIGDCSASRSPGPT